jgi:hypothetical protein
MEEEAKSVYEEALNALRGRPNYSRQTGGKTAADKPNAANAGDKTSANTKTGAKKTRKRFARLDRRTLQRSPNDILFDSAFAQLAVALSRTAQDLSAGFDAMFDRNPERAMRLLRMGVAAGGIAARALLDAEKSRLVRSKIYLERSREMLLKAKKEVEEARLAAVARLERNGTADGTKASVR